MKMAMGYFETSNDESNAVALVERFLCQANFFSDDHEVARSCIRNIGPLVNFLNRYNQGVASRDRINCQKRNAQVVFVHEMSRNFAKNDACKQRWHDGDCSVVDCER